jgi:hypothetical protein
MADTLAATGLRVQRWEDRFFTEYLTENRFSESMGSDENAVIQVKEVLGKGKGDSTTIALVNRLTNTAILGSNMLEGFEEDMSSRSQRIYIDKRRNAVRIAEMEEIKSAIDLRDAGRATLKDWAMKDTEQMLIDALQSVLGIAYGTASATNKNDWNNYNYDRVLYGAARGNNGLTAGSAFRDLKTNATITQAQREVSLEVENNRLFEGGDILWDGMIVKEVPGIGFTTNGTIECAPVYLCGAQALAIVYGKRWSTITKTFDYGDKYGIAIEGILGVRKIQFGTGANDLDNLKDNGVVTGWFAAVASA